MEEKGLINRKEGFFTKLTLFFKKLFKKDEVDVNEIEPKDEMENVTNEINKGISQSLHDLVIDDISEHYKKQIEKEVLEDLMSKTGSNKDDLLKLDIGTLNKMNNLYDEKITDLKYKIYELKTKLSTN